MSNRIGMAGVCLINSAIWASSVNTSPIAALVSGLVWAALAIVVAYRND